MLDYVILGAGITGVAVARLLQQRGRESFVVLEREAEPGGLCRTRDVEGRVLDTGGGHFLCSAHPEVYDFIFAHLPREAFNWYGRVSKIEVEGHIVDYPIESNLWQLPLDLQTDYLVSAVQAGEVIGRAAPKNYEQWIRWKLGDRVAERYMLPYNQKIWGVAPRAMDVDWLHKIPRLDTREIVRASLAHANDPRKFPSHAGFYYPKEGGFQRIFDAIHAPVRDHVRLREPLRSLRRERGRWVVNGRYEAREVINTIPWPAVFRAAGRPARLTAHVARLRVNRLVVSLWERSYDHDWHWLYLPDPARAQHREFFIDNFAAGSRRGAAYTETNAKRWPGPGAAWPGADDRPLYEHVNACAYPIPVLGHEAAARAVIDHFGARGVHGVGRWGQWKYFNSDVCVREAMRLVARLT